MGFPQNGPLFRSQPSGSATAAGSAGAKNYLGTVNGVNGNGDFELGATTGWSLGTATLTSNLPTGAPTFGSGASGNLSIAAVTSGKLAGTYSMSYASSAATTAGNFVASQAFTIDTEDQAKVMSFRFYYSPTVNPTNGNWSGTTSNSFGVAIYDVTNSAWIIPAGVFAMTQGSGVGYATGTFQTTSNSTSYRFVVYNANATSNSITVLFDDFFLGPQTAPYGPIATDWVSYTPTGSWTTNSTYTGRWRRVGGNMEVQASIALTGAPDNVSITAMALPAGFTIDTSKLSEGSPTIGERPKLGEAYFSDNGVTSYSGVVLYSTTTAVYIYATTANGTYASVANLSQTIPFTWGNGDRLDCYFSVPITGWSSNVQMSNDTDTRVVACRASGATTSVANNTVVLAINPTATYDTHGAYSTSTGRFTVPVTGIYRVTGGCKYTSAAHLINEVMEIYLYKNAAAYSTMQRILIGGSITNSFEVNGADTVSCVAGDILDIRTLQQQSGTVTLDGTNGNFFAVERVSGPAVVAATESVNARYFASATALSGSLATIVWTTKDYDTHNAMSSGVFTIPVSGKYYVGAALAVAGTLILNNTSVIEIQKNSVAVSNLTRYAGGAITNDGIDIEDMISCVAGDTIRIQVSNSGTTPTIVSSNTRNFFSIFRVGN